MPEAEVDVDILNVCFGDVVYQGVTESEAAYIDRGPREAEAHTREYSRIYNFFRKCISYF